jgi:hypothetical protein
VGGKNKIGRDLKIQAHFVRSLCAVVVVGPWESGELGILIFMRRVTGADNYVIQKCKQEVKNMLLRV